MMKDINMGRRKGEEEFTGDRLVWDREQCNPVAAPALPSLQGKGSI